MRTTKDKTPPGWRKINAKHWWSSGVGATTRTDEGWVASASGYESVILEPNVGPFKTAYEAMHAWERFRTERATAANLKVGGRRKA